MYVLTSISCACSAASSSASFVNIGAMASTTCVTAFSLVVTVQGKSTTADRMALVDEFSVSIGEQFRSENVVGKKKEELLGCRL